MRHKPAVQGWPVALVHKVPSLGWPCHKNVCAGVRAHACPALPAAGGRQYSEAVEDCNRVPGGLSKAYGESAGRRLGESINRQGV